MLEPTDWLVLASIMATHFAGSPAASGSALLSVPLLVLVLSKELYRDKFSIDLETYTGDASWALPMPAGNRTDSTHGYERHEIAVCKV